MTRRTVLASVFLSVLLAGRARTQETAGRVEQPPTFPARLEQVTVDVVVTDGKGNPLTGFKKEDLQVLEDGVPQTIVSFEAFEVPALAAGKPAAPPRVSTNAAREGPNGRTFVIVFDDVHLTAFTAQRAKAAIADFLKTGTREGDRVTLSATGGRAFWSVRMEAGRDALVELVKRLSGTYVPDTARDRLSDYEAMRIHVFRDENIMNRVQRRFETYGLPTTQQLGRDRSDFRGTEDPVITSRAAEVYYGVAARNRATLDTLERALKALVPRKGRKSLILVSDGFVYDPELAEFKRLVDASRRANTAIYFLNTRGLEGLPISLGADVSGPLPAQDIGFAFSQSEEETEGSESLAADSGGFAIRNTNDLAGGLQRIGNETRAYYLIGYNPKNTARDGLFRKIQVKVPGRKGVQVRARKGYYAPSDLNAPPAPGVSSVFQEALDTPYEVGDIPLRMTHFVREETLLGKARVLLATEVDIRGLGFEEKDGRRMGALQLLLVASHRESGENFRYDQTMDLKLVPATYERMARSGLPIVRDFELGAGAYQAKIVVMDKATGRVGTVVHRFEVPDLGQLRVSTPVLSDVRESAPDGGSGEGLAILARRDFPQGGSLFCQFDVYGATREQTSGLPRMAMGYVVRRSDGTLLTGDPPSLIIPTPLGAVSRMIGFSLAGATPGDYELVLSFKDQFSGKTLELREPFTVVPP